MKTLLNSEGIAYFIDFVVELTEDAVLLNSNGINQQFNSSNSTITELSVPYPQLNGVWKLVDGEWVCIDQAAVDAYLAAQKAQFNDAQSKKRFAAYTVESDPIFFKSQRGEATNQEWLDAIAAIDARFPYQE
jgi:hypothetical protein